jgi:hypothetical protein
MRRLPDQILGVVLAALLQRRRSMCTTSLNGYQVATYQEADTSTQWLLDSFLAISIDAFSLMVSASGSSERKDAKRMDGKKEKWPAISKTAGAKEVERRLAHAESNGDYPGFPGEHSK